VGPAFPSLEEMSKIGRMSEGSFLPEAVVKERPRIVDRAAVVHRAGQVGRLLGQKLTHRFKRGGPRTFLESFASEIEAFEILGTCPIFLQRQDGGHQARVRGSGRPNLRNRAQPRSRAVPDVSGSSSKLSHNC